MSLGVKRAFGVRRSATGRIRRGELYAAFSRQPARQNNRGVNGERFAAVRAKSQRIAPTAMRLLIQCVTHQLRSCRMTAVLLATGSFFAHCPLTRTR